MYSLTSGLAGTRDLEARPYSSWDEAFDALAGRTRKPVLVVLDEFPDLLGARTV